MQNNHHKFQKKGKLSIILILVTLTFFFADQNRTNADENSVNQLSVPAQPLLSQVHRLSEALSVIGNPLEKEASTRISKIKNLKSAERITTEVQQIFDPLCLAVVEIQENGPSKVSQGLAKPELMEQGWRTFLIKIINPKKKVGKLIIESPNAKPIANSPAEEVESRWMQISAFEGQPIRPKLSGLPLEYRILQVYSRDRGNKSAILSFNMIEESEENGHLVKEWKFDNGTDGWRELNQIKLNAIDGSLQIESTGGDPFMATNINHKGGPYVLRFWAKSEVDGVGELFWWTKEIRQPTGGRQVNFPLHQGKEKLYEISFSTEGELAGMRLDPLIKPGKMRIDWINLYSKHRIEDWAKLPLKFDAVPATKLTFRIKDLEDLPPFGKFEITDEKGQIYPAQSKRLAPDFFFQRHIYRGDGESVLLPPGNYRIICSRGPETLPEIKNITINDKPQELHYEVKRWIDPAQLGWWSGDHHIHAAGCQHYENPTKGVQPNDMIRHLMGEDLKVGCCLTWGPCFDYQKQFFTGKVNDQSDYPYTLRYDIEVSGFGSHVSGHLNLLNLKQQIYPGGKSKNHWPTLGLNTLRWAKKQGAVCGPAHSGSGLTEMVGRVPNTEGKDGELGLPHFNIPAYDGIGANEFILNVTHRVPGPNGKLVPAVDFISTMDTSRVAEWNMWYHVLNCGFRITASGETDFPCISGERVGMGRVYAKVDGRLTFAKWVQSIADGRSYVSDGLCHLLNFSAKSKKSSVELGTNKSELRIKEEEEITLNVNAAALLEENDEIKIELIVNGYPVSEKNILSDGRTSKITFKHSIKESCWAAVRVFPHAHTNPIHVIVNEKPMRGLIDSARWCLAGVEQCWKSKQQTYAAAEKEDAIKAYDHARKVYNKIIEEASVIYQ